MQHDCKNKLKAITMIKLMDLNLGFNMAKNALLSVKL